MLKIKLARFGKRRQPEYRIVVNEAKDKRDGKYVALLGHYAPTRSPKVLTLDIAEYDQWVKKGAQPTETVAALAKRASLKNPFPKKKAKLSRKAKEKAAQKSGAPAQPAPEENQAKASASIESSTNDQAESKAEKAQDATKELSQAETPVAES